MFGTNHVRPIGLKNLDWKGSFLLGRDRKMVSKPLWNSAVKMPSNTDDFCGLKVPAAHFTLAFEHTSFVSLQFTFFSFLPVVGVKRSAIAFHLGVGPRQMSWEKQMYSVLLIIVLSAVFPLKTESRLFYSLTEFFGTVSFRAAICRQCIFVSRPVSGFFALMKYFALLCSHSDWVPVPLG